MAYLTTRLCGFFYALSTAIFLAEVLGFMVLD